MDLPEELNAETVELIWERKLSNYIEDKFGRPWSIQQNHMFVQETIHTLEAYRDPEATALVEEWLASPRCAFPGRQGQATLAGLHWSVLGEGATLGESVEIYTDTLLAELCNRGLLPERKLMVHVWW